MLTQDNRFAESLEGEGGKPKNMSSLLDRIEERGRQKGLDEGHREGRQEGRQEGFREGADQKCLENIRSLMESMKLTGTGETRPKWFPVRSIPRGPHM